MKMSRAIIQLVVLLLGAATIVSLYYYKYYKMTIPVLASKSSNFGIYAIRIITPNEMEFMVQDPSTLNGGYRIRGRLKEVVSPVAKEDIIRLLNRAERVKISILGSEKIEGGEINIVDVVLDVKGEKCPVNLLDWLQQNSLVYKTK